MHGSGKHREAWGHLHEAFRLTEKLKSKIFEYYGLMIEAHFYFEQGDEIRVWPRFGKPWPLERKKDF